jgi:2-hydroxy-3-oxopropionate reductase
MTDNQPRIAFIGLGIMGGPMAANLVKAGYDVTGYNRSRGKVDALVEAGGTGADSIAEAVAGADVIITIVPDSPDVEQVAGGEDGILAHARSGAVWVDCSSIRPDVAVALAEQAAEKGIKAVDAPVSGGEAGAIEATLSIMVGGDADAVESVRPVLEAVGKTVVHVGPSGSGQTVKAANQLIVAGTIELVAEALVFLEAYGVDTAAAIEVLAGGLAGNRILDRKATSMVAREFKPGFRVDLHHKDLNIALESGDAFGVALPATSLAQQMLRTLRARGRGAEDHSALLTVIEDWAGHRVGTEEEIACPA